MKKRFFKKTFQVLSLFSILFCCFSCGSKKLKFEEVITNEEDGFTIVASNDKPFTGTIIDNVGFYELVDELPGKSDLCFLMEPYCDEYKKESFIVNLQYKKGYRHGESTYSFKSTGKTAFVETFKNGKRHGTFKLYGKNGKLMLEQDFKNGKPDGSHKCRFWDGSLIHDGKFDEGKKIGKWLDYFSYEYGVSNMPVQEEIFDKNGLPLSDTRYFFTEKKDKKQIPRSKTEWVYDKKNPQIYTETGYTVPVSMLGDIENSKLVISYHREYDKSEGKDKNQRGGLITDENYQNGKIYERHHYDEKGRDHGLFERFNDNGDVTFSIKYEHGNVVK